VASGRIGVGKLWFLSQSWPRVSDSFESDLVSKYAGNKLIVSLYRLQIETEIKKFSNVEKFGTDLFVLIVP
jgi:hypothetical protein